MDIFVVTLRSEGPIKAFHTKLAAQGFIKQLGSDRQFRESYGLVRGELDYLLIKTIELM